jgi:hypothetical protein
VILPEPLGGETVGSEAARSTTSAPKHAWRNQSWEPAVSLIVTTARLGRFFREIGTPVSPGATVPASPSALAVMALLAAALLAGCASDDGEPPQSASGPQASDGEQRDEGSTIAPPPPDAGLDTGHGADPTRVAVPESPEDPPSATIALASPVGGRTLARAAQPGGGAETTVRLSESRLRGTTVGEDDDEGVARVRVSISERITCLGADGSRDIRRRTRYHPPPQIERIRSTPGARLPARRARSLILSIGEGRCGPGAKPTEVHGELWGEAINGSGLEAVTPHIRFSHSARD